MKICSTCDNEFEGESFVCGKGQNDRAECAEAEFCSEQCQLVHYNEEHGEE